MRIQTQRLRLEPDKEVPGLKRLRFSPVEVTVEDVFLKGIHPHSVVRAGNQHDYTGMADIILAKLNESTAYSAELKAHNLGHEIAEAGCLEQHDHPPCRRRQNLARRRDRADRQPGQDAVARGRRGEN